MDSNEHDSEYIKEIRVSYETFNVLCHELQPYNKKQDTNKRKGIPVEQQVAVSLYRIARGATY